MWWSAGRLAWLCWKRPRRCRITVMYASTLVGVAAMSCPCSVIRTVAMIGWVAVSMTLTAVVGVLWAT